MKTKKWIVGLLSVSSVGAVVPMVTGCKDQTNEPEVSEKYPKVREVGKKAERTYFLLKQKNVNRPEDTKVKMVNLTVNGASANPVDGLIKYQADSGGNVFVVFNMALAIQHYGANSVTFSLQLTNKTAGTDWTVDGFEVKVSTKGYDIELPAESDISGITWINPSSPETHIGIDENYELTFKLEKGYVFSDTEGDCDILVGDTSVKDKDDVIFELKKDEQECHILVPSEYISDNITLKLKTIAREYQVTWSVDENYTVGEQFTSVTHSSGLKTTEFHPNDYYQTVEWNVEMDYDQTGTEWESIKDKGARLIDNDKTLEIDTSKVIGNLRVTSTAEKKSFSVSMKQDTGKHLSFDTQSVPYDTKVTGSISSDHRGYRAAATLKAYVTDEDQPSRSGEFTIETKYNEATDTCDFEIDKAYVHGNIVITGVTENATYKVDSSTILAKDFVKFTGDSTVEYTKEYSGTLETTDKYHKMKTWDVKCQKTSGGQYESIKELSPGAHWDSSTNALTIDGNANIGNMSITAEAEPQTWTCTLGSTHKSITGLTLSGTPTYGLPFTATINTVDPLYYNIGISKIVLDDAEKGERELKLTDDYTYDATTRVISFKQTAVTGNITIYPNPTAKKWNLSVVDGQSAPHKDQYTYVGDTGDDKAIHDTPYTATITPKDHYKLAKGNITVTSGGADAGFSYDGTTLTIPGENIIGAVVITIKPQPETFTAKDPETTNHLTVTKSSATPTYNEDYVFSYSLDNGYLIDEDSIKCYVGTSETPLTKTSGLSINTTAHTITVAGDKITGDLLLKGSGKAETYSLTFDITGYQISGTKPTPTFGSKLDINVAQSTAGYIFNLEDFQGDNPKITVSVGGTTLTYGTFTVTKTSDTAGTISIPAEKVTGNVSINGEVTLFSTTVGGLTGLTMTSNPIQYRKSTALTFNATLSDNYADPVATVSGGAITTSDYEVTVNNKTVTFNVTNATNLTAPLSITLNATSTELEFNNTADVAIGDTGTYTANVKGQTSKKATVTIKTQPGTDASITDAGVLTAGSTSGQIVLLATYQGATKEQTINVVKPDVVIAGPTSVEVGSTTTTALSYTFSPDITAAVKAGATVTYSASPENYVTIDDDGYVTGVTAGDVEITATVKYGSPQVTVTSSTTHKITVSEPVVPELSITGSVHILDDTDTTGFELQAFYGTTDVTGSESTTWSVELPSSYKYTNADTPSVSVALGGSGKEIVTVNNEWTDYCHGSAIVKCSFVTSTNETLTKEWEVEVASFNKCQFTTSSVKAADGVPTGKLIVPSRYWDSTASDWVTVDTIAHHGFANFYSTEGSYIAAVTDVYIPKTIKTISDSAFYGMSSSAPETSTLTSITFASDSTLEKIGSGAFRNNANPNFTYITLPASLTEVGSHAFVLGDAITPSLTGIEFGDTSNWYTGSGYTTLTTIATDTPATNVTNFKISTSRYGNFGVKKIS